MAIHFLECDVFHAMILEKARVEHYELMQRDPTVSGVYGIGVPDCCPRCHEKDQNRIYVRPYKDDGLNTEWDFGLEAIVCCQLFDFVRALPREWWEQKAKELGVYKSRNDGRGYSYSDHPERDTDHGKTSTPQAKIKRATAKAEDDEKAGGLAGFLGRR